MESEDLINEQAGLIARGVRPLALLGTCGLDENEMANRFVLLNQKMVGPALAFVLPRKDFPCAMTGYAAAKWVIDLLEWSYEHAPLRQQHQIMGLLLGYSVSQIAEHDAREFAGKPITDESTSM